MSALDTLLAKCRDDAQRVELLRESLDMANAAASFEAAIESGSFVTVWAGE